MNELQAQFKLLLEQIPEEQEKVIGQSLARFGNFKKSKKHADRFLTGDGHGEKTDLGVTRSVFWIILQNLK